MRGLHGEPGDIPADEDVIAEDDIDAWLTRELGGLTEAERIIKYAEWRNLPEDIPTAEVSGDK